MRKQTREFVEKFLESHPFRGGVLDVGSLNINGDLRLLFEKKGNKYTGADMRRGENVDVIVNAHQLTERFGEEHFDMVCCFDTLEHDEAFWVTITHLKAVLKSGGWLLLGVPGGNCPKHDHPQDYWRFMENGVQSLLYGLVDTYTETQKDNPESLLDDEIYGWGKKP